MDLLDQQFLQEGWGMEPEDLGICILRDIFN